MTLDPEHFEAIFDELLDMGALEVEDTVWERGRQVPRCRITPLGKEILRHLDDGATVEVTTSPEGEHQISAIRLGGDHGGDDAGPE